MSCSHCEKRFIHQASLENHIRAKHSQQSNVCEVCGKAFDWMSSLSRHMKNVHREGADKEGVYETVVKEDSDNE